jgi:hypothetical protein
MTAKSAFPPRRYHAYWFNRSGKAQSFSRSPYQYAWRFHRLIRYGSSESKGPSSSSTNSFENKHNAPRDDRTSSNAKKNATHDEAWMAKDIYAWHDALAKMTEEELKAVSRIIRQNPYNFVFGSAANHAFDPFRRTREWAEKFWSMLPEATTSEEMRSRYSPKDARASNHAATKIPAGNMIRDKVAREEHAAQPQSTFAPQSSALMEEVYDPITSRKVMRPVIQFETTTSNAKHQAENPAKTNVEATDVPVKKFVYSPPISDLGKEEVEALSANGLKSGKPELAGFARQPWLQKEGFTKAAQHAIAIPRAPTKPLSPARKASISKPFSEKAEAGWEKLQASIDRILERDAAKAPATFTSSEPSKKLKESSVATPKPHNISKENEKEDLDLLRAHDIRAAVGHPKTNIQPSRDEEISTRRQRLDVAFANSQEKLNTMLFDEFLHALASDSPNHAHLMKLWTVYTQTAILKHRNRSKQFNTNFLQDMITRIKLDSKNIRPAQGTVRMVTGKGTSLGRYLAANRLSKAIDEGIAAYENINEGLYQRVGQKPEQTQTLKEVYARFRASTEAYKAELRNQILSVPEKSKATGKSAEETVLELEGPKKLADLQPVVPLYEENVKLVKEHEEGLERAKMQRQKQREKRLYHEIKDIYEGEYGMLNTGHRQKSKDTVPSPTSASQLSVSSSVPTTSKVPATLHTYCILTYDDMNNTVISAITRSSVTDGPPKTPARIFMELERVQPFVQEMNKLQASGWELIDGNKGMLVFRQLPQTASTATTTLAAPASVAVSTPVTATTSSDAEERTSQASPNSAYSFASSAHEQPPAKVAEAPVQQDSLPASRKPIDHASPFFSSAATLTPLARGEASNSNPNTSTTSIPDISSTSTSTSVSNHPSTFTPAISPWRHIAPTHTRARRAKLHSKSGRARFWANVALAVVGSVVPVFVLLYCAGALMQGRLERERERERQEREAQRKREKAREMEREGSWMSGGWAWGW